MTVYIPVGTVQMNRSNLIEFKDISKALEGMPKEQEDTREPDPRNGPVRIPKPLDSFLGSELPGP